MAAPEPIPTDLTPEAVEVFCSYSHKDDALREELEKHLSILQANGIISSWHDHAIPAGKEWDSQIDEHLNSARIILLLISPDFLASKYCREVEVHRALERHKAGEATVIPVMLRDVDWHGSALSKLQALPKNAIPVISWPNHDQAFKDVAVGIRKVATGLRRPPVKQRAEAPKVEAPKVVVNPVEREHHPAKSRLKTYVVVGMILAVFLSGAGYLVNRRLELQRKDWSHVRFDDPDFSGCMGVHPCLERKALSDTLKAADGTAIRFDSSLLTDCMSFPPCLERKTHSGVLVATDWTKVRFDSPLLSDCMGLPACLARASVALRLKAITDWTKVRVTESALLTDCMEYDPCQQAKKAFPNPHGGSSEDDADAPPLKRLDYFNKPKSHP